MPPYFDLEHRSCFHFAGVAFFDAECSPVCLLDISHIAKRHEACVGMQWYPCIRDTSGIRFAPARPLRPLCWEAGAKQITCSYSAQYHARHPQCLWLQPSEVQIVRCQACRWVSCKRKEGRCMAGAPTANFPTSASQTL